ncbi:MAG: guanylate kinase [Pseudomonadota bacterium]
MTKFKDLNATPIIIAAPSGAGKTSLVNEVCKTLKNISVSISHTTRVKRQNEVDGLNYHFIPQSQFTEMINNDEFLEYAKVFGHYYGTSYAKVLQQLNQGIDVIFEIDWQGAQQIKQTFTECLTIFILPPSLQVLRQRLLKRGMDDTKTIDVRMQQARDEISHVKEFDYLIINDDFAKSAEQMLAIIQANRLRLERQLYENKALILPMLKHD